MRETRMRSTYICKVSSSKGVKGQETALLLREPCLLLIILSRVAFGYVVSISPELGHGNEILGS